MHADDPNGLFYLVLFWFDTESGTPELIIPAVKGTLGILNSALKYGYVLKNFTENYLIVVIPALL